MSADLSDPQILPVYSAIVRNDPTNWLLLTYGQTRDKLSLLATGTRGIDELATHLTDDDIYFAFVREDKAFAIISYFPAGIPGVRRARALVHSRAVTSLFKVANTTYVATAREQVGTNQVRARLGLPPIAGIARGFQSQGPASLPANAENMPMYQSTPAGRVGSPTTRADSPGGGRAPAGYNARRTESPSFDSQGASRIPRPGQQPAGAGGGGARKPIPRNAYGRGQGLAPPSSSASGAGSRISDAPSFEVDGKASYYAPGMQVDSRETSLYEPPIGRGVGGVYEWERERKELVYDEQNKHYARDPKYQSTRNGHGSPSHHNHNSDNSKFSQQPPPVRNVGGRIPSQDRDLPPPPPQSQDDEEEFEIIVGAEDMDGYPDIPTPTAPRVPASASSSSPPPVPRKSADSYGYKRPDSVFSSESGFGLPRESTDSVTGGMQSTLFRTEAQELRARWTAQENEKEEREKREREHEQQKAARATAPRANGGRYIDRRKESFGTNASSELQTPVSAGTNGGVARDSLYMSEGEFGGTRSDTGGASRRRKGRTKSLIALEREREEQEMVRTAAELAARKKWEKEQHLREEMEEEERKKAEFEEAARRRAAERLKREQLRRAEEERERQELEAKKKAQQEKRLEEARKAEERRRELQRREEEARQREEGRKQSAAEERSKRMREIQERFDKLRETNDVLLTGFLTVQAGNTVVWRRRYFQLMGDRMTLHRKAEETQKILENIDLNGTIKAIKEWDQGYDELRAIPHSWAIEFTNDAPWQFYADSEEDKDVLISLLTQVSDSPAW